MHNDMTIEARIAYLQKRGVFVAPYLDFQRQVLTLQAGQRAQLDRPPLFAPADEMASRLQRGLPLLTEATICSDAALARSSLAELLSLFASWPDQYPPATIAALQGVLQNGEPAASDLVQAFVSAQWEPFRRWSAALAVDPGLLIFIARTISFPFLAAHADALQAPLAQRDKSWLRPSCPLCGNAAAMARLEKEAGQRRLWCAACHTEWAFARTPCVCCGHDAPQGSRYFYDDDQSLYRVYVCGACQRYLKTVDEKKYAFIHPLDLGLEELLTQQLDEIASREGLQSTLWWKRGGGADHERPSPGKETPAEIPATRGPKETYL